MPDCSYFLEGNQLCFLSCKTSMLVSCFHRQFDHFLNLECLILSLAGLCTNESCPYRHVNVNPKAAVCEGFLRGYCVDGDLVSHFFLSGHVSYFSFH
jgi:hypothetical protein